MAKVKFGELILSLTSYDICCAKGDVLLTNHQHIFLATLIMKQGRVVLHPTIYNLIHGKSRYSVDAPHCKKYVRELAFQVRRELTAHGVLDGWVKTIDGWGYQLCNGSKALCDIENAQLAELANAINRRTK